MSAELLLESRQDRPRRPDGKLLADDLKDEGPEGIKRRKFFEPSPRVEVRLRIDDPSEDRIDLSKKLPRLGVSQRADLGAPDNASLRHDTTDLRIRDAASS